MLSSGPRLALVGAPGSGKTSVGRALAEQAELDFVDTDEEIGAAAGMPVGEIFAVAGEDAFAAYQHDAVLRALTKTGIVAVSSGAIVDPDVRLALATVPVVWLRIDATHSSRRSGLSAVSPAFFAGMRARMVQQIAERDPLYAAVADHVVDTNPLSLHDVIAATARVTGIVG